MAFLDQLKLAQKQRPVDLAPEQRLRMKMVAALDKQIAAAIHDWGPGGRYERYEFETVTNPDTGETEQKKVKKRFQRWWWIDENMKMFLGLFYANRPIEIRPKKTAIEIDDETKLVDTLKALREAVLAGELDPQLTKAAEARKAQFATRKRKTAA